MVGERRHLTVLFCDLVGSTAIAAQLDPEEWRETVGGYHRVAAEAITRFGGHVAKYLGDGVMAFFGWPEAHDNDAERAARAGLAILDAIAKLNEQPGHAKLSARVGIDSGPVVVGEGAGNEADVFGDTPNIAARVQAAADPGTVLITAATHRLVSGLFVVEDRGAQALKGIERPLQLYRVIQPSGVRGRLEAAAAARGLTPFVGREDELRSLMNRWERALEGEGQVALIIGEAGIGKSRLVQRFREQIAGTPHTWIEAAAAPFFQNTPFYPVAEMLRQMLAWRRRPCRGAARATGVGVGAGGTRACEAMPLIAPLLNLPLPPELSALIVVARAAAPPPAGDAGRVGAGRCPRAAAGDRDRRFALGRPVDAGADPDCWSSRGRGAAAAPVHGAARVSCAVAAAGASYANHAQPARARATCARWWTQVAAQKALSEETIATVVERTGGVPLFVEELTRAVLESGDAKLTGREIPATLHDSLMARLDRLGPAKEVIQVGAVIGSEFSYELLHAVHPIAEGGSAGRAARSSTDAELLYVRGIAPEATYQFKHALIRDAAYEALLKSRRRNCIGWSRTRSMRSSRSSGGASRSARAPLDGSGRNRAGDRRMVESGQGRGGAQRVQGSAGELPAGSGAAQLTCPNRPSVTFANWSLGNQSSMLRVTQRYAAPETIELLRSALQRWPRRVAHLEQLSKSAGHKCSARRTSGDLPTARGFADQALEFALSARESPLIARRIWCSR